MRQVKAEDEPKWAAQRAAQELIDQPEIEAAGLRLAEWLIETPETHVILDCDYEAGAADGWGAPTYKYQGIEIRPHIDGIPSLRTHLASAGRPGALGSFWHFLNGHGGSRPKSTAAVAGSPKTEAGSGGTYPRAWRGLLLLLRDILPRRLWGLRPHSGAAPPGKTAT